MEHGSAALDRNDADDAVGIGSTRAARVVLRALAEHIGYCFWQTVWGAATGEPTGGAPIGTHEGACAPQNEVNRSTKLGHRQHRRQHRPRSRLAIRDR